MSHGNITIPITVDYVERPGLLEPVTRNLLIDSDTERFCFVAKPAFVLHGPFDPWELRKDFLSWPLKHWQGFIAMAGCFHPMPVSQRDFEQCQRLLRAALTCPARQWGQLQKEFAGTDRLVSLSSISWLRFQWEGKVPTAQMWALCSLDAILATIQIDKLQGAEFRVCARHDCKSAPFRVEARHKIFCDPACAHLVAVRRSRERAAKAKATKKAPNRKQGGGKGQ